MILWLMILWFLVMKIHEETLKSRRMWLWADGGQPAETALVVEMLLDTDIKGLTGKYFLVQNSAFSSA